MNLSLGQEAEAGLKSTPPFISPKFFYDDMGSRLFEAITLLEEYYPTRIEKSIMQAHANDIASAVGPCDLLLDLGAGNCAKASALFDSIKPKHYLALDISTDFLGLAVADLQKRFPQIQMEARTCDLSQTLDFPDLVRRKKTFFYPGSSIGNFDPKQASIFCKNISALCDGAGGLLIGVDLVKESAILDRAYNDALGITAAFNLNALLHINRLLGSNFVLSDWEHYAIFNESQSRIEMYLRAVRDIEIVWSTGKLALRAGQMIHTENSFKYTKASFTNMLLDAGFKKTTSWTDDKGYFLICYASAT
jgi:dimethylhistidine N-methyltransferase